MRPVTIHDGRVVTHGPATTNSGSASSSVGDAALRDFLSSFEEELSAGRASGIWFGREEATALRSLLARLAAAETALADRDRHFLWDDRLRMEREIGDLATRLATAEAERDRLLSAMQRDGWSPLTCGVCHTEYPAPNCPTCSGRRPPTPGDTP